MNFPHELSESPPKYFLYNKHKESQGHPWALLTEYRDSHGPIDGQWPVACTELHTRHLSAVVFPVHFLVCRRVVQLIQTQFLKYVSYVK